MTRDRIAGTARRVGRTSARVGRGASSTAYGLRQKARHLRERPKPQPDGVTLAHKVETEIFREPDIPKGQINVNSVDGVLYLRGETEQPEMIRELVEKTRKVQGVREVESLLHTPGSPVPTT